MTLRIQAIGPFAQRTGYGKAFHDYLMALKLVGADLRVVPIIDCDTDHLASQYVELLPLLGAHDDADVVLVHTIPGYAHEFVTGDLAPRPGVKKVCLTTWESTRLPLETARHLNAHFDLVIVPATFTQAVFAEALPALGQKTVVVPHTFSNKFWSAPASGKFATDKFVFYNIGVWSERKNPIGLLKAYFSEFTADDNVLLRMVTPFVNEEDVRALARAMNLDHLPPVEFLGRGAYLSDEDLRDLHHAGDCYVTLTRGEGWNLGAFEACLSGNVVIATDFSGQTDFLGDYPGWRPVPCFMTPAVSPELALGQALEIGGIKVTPQGTRAPLGLDGRQEWAEPDLGTAKQLMRREYAQGKYPHTPWLRRDAYSYVSVGLRFLDALKNGK